MSICLGLAGADGLPEVDSIPITRSIFASTNRIRDNPQILSCFDMLSITHWYNGFKAIQHRLYLSLLSLLTMNVALNKRMKNPNQPIVISSSQFPGPAAAASESRLPRRMNPPRNREWRPAIKTGKLRADPSSGKTKKEATRHPPGRPSQP
jgi:hypothetical protein